MDSIVASNRRPAPRLARPAERYWKGKLPKGVDAAQQGSDSEEEIQEEDAELVKDVPLGAVGEGEPDGPEGVISRSTEPAKLRQQTMNLSLKDVKVSSEGRVTVAGKMESGRTKEGAPP
jgi:microfibrillar-associated protein 1